MNISTNEKNKTFIEKFHPEKFGFFDLMPFTNVNIGFSVKKRLDKLDDNITLLSVHIPQKIFEEKNSTKKLLSIYATYGKESEGGVMIRENPKLSDPIDVSFPNQYYYDIENEEFFKKNKKITADKLLEETYNNHIKSTKLIKGLYARAKITFYWKILKLFFEYISIYFHGILYLISGNLYSYSPIFDERRRNGRIISSTISPPDKRHENLEKEEKESKRINFLGYETSSFCIFFYSSLHLYLYFALRYSNFNLPLFINKVFQNSFLILVYVMFSLIIIDKVLPPIFELLIDIFSRWSFKVQHKTIKL
jgi:hypothetical protein